MAGTAFGARGTRRLLAGLGLVSAMGCAPGDPMPARRGADRSPVASAGGPAGWTPKLAEELRSMGRQDQEVRRGLGPETMADTAFLGRMARVDSANSRRLRALVATHGWPTAAAVGGEAAEGAFLIVQHTPFGEWQRAMLPRVEDGVRDGSLDAQDYALLYDRVQVHLGRPQRYGTQLVSGAAGTLRLEPLEDPDGVDSLRAALGLVPLDVYLRTVGEIYHMKVERPAAGG